MSVPNIITVFRILLIPVFVTQLFSGHYYAAFCLLLLSGLTDVLDGFIARKFNMVTKLGTVLDPLADKLVQFTVFICLYAADLIPLWLVLLLMIKELSMGVGTFVLLKHRVVVKANASGKIATVVFYLTAVVVFILRFKFPQMELCGVATTLACIAVISAFYAMGSYARIFFKVLKDGKEAEIKHE